MSASKLKDKNTKKKSYIKGAGILAFFGIIAKLIGGLYRIPLTNILGAEGMGFYQLIFPVYALLLALTSTAIPNLLARQISRDARGDYGYAVFYRAVKLLAVVGLAVTLLLVAISRPLSSLQGKSEMYIGYIVIAPSLFFVAIMSTFRGWFNARLEMLPTSMSIFTEQIIKFAAGLTLTILLTPYGILIMTVGALLGVTISELAGLIIIAVFYFAKGHKFKKPSLKIPAFALFSASIPFTLGGMILPLTYFLDSILIVNLLILGGTVSAVAIGEYGIMSGTIGSLVNFPVVLTISLAVAVIPIISRKKQERDINGIKYNGSLTMKIALSVALPFAIGLMLLSNSIVRVLYPNLTARELWIAEQLLMVLAVGIPFLALMQIYNSLLQALDKSNLTARNIAISGAVKIIGNVILIPFIGIMGGAISTVMCFITGFSLNIITYNRLTGYNKKLLKKVAELTGAGVIMTLFVSIMSIIFKNNYIKILSAALIGSVVYGIMLWILKVFDKDELKLILGRGE